MSRYNPSQIGELEHQYIDVTWYGAKGDGATDDTAAIQDAINHFTSSAKKGTVFLPTPGVSYKITAALTIDLSYVALVGNHAKIDASSITAGNIFTITASASPPYTQNFRALSGIEIQGNGKSGSVIAISLSGPSSNTGASHFEFSNINIHDVGTAVLYGSNTYIVNHDNCDFWNCGTILQMNNGGTNYGERMTFAKCTMFNSNTVLNCQNSTSDWFFDQCSMDYNNQAIVIGGCLVRIDNSHIEFNETGFNHFSLTGGSLVIANTWIDFSGTELSGTNDIIHGTSLGNGGITLRDVFINNAPTDRIVSTDGTGHVFASGIHGFGTDTLFLISNAIGILPDPSFEGAHAAQQYTATQAGTGTVTIDATTAHTGTHSVKFYKPVTTDSSYIDIYIPMNASQRVFADFYNKWTSVVQGTQTYESWFMHFAYADANKNDLLSGEKYATGSSNGWVHEQCSFYRDNVPPPGTTYAHIVIALNGGSTGTAWIDDLYINIV